MAALYEIDSEILKCIDLETGEVIDPLKLDMLQIERDQKIENAALWYKNILSDAAAYEKEEKEFSKKRKAAENKAKSLKYWLSNALDGETFETTRVRVSYRKSESVECEDLSKVKECYIRLERTLNKEMVKQALKDEIPVEGCRLIEKQNIQIK